MKIMTTWWCDHNVLYNFSLSLNQFWNTIFFSWVRRLWWDFEVWRYVKKLWLLEILSKLEIVFCGTGFCIQTWLPCSLENWLIDIQNAMSKFCLMKMEKINKKLTVVVATITKPKWGKTRRDKRKRGKHFVSVEQFFFIKTHYNIFNWSQRDNLAVRSGLIS